jgi:hydrogenase maturation protein HypF
VHTEGIFAAGAELVNSFALGKGNQVLMSQYVGDLKNMETYEFYREIYERYCRMFRFTPALVVHDLHPDYLSTRFARELAQEHGDLPRVPVQHHHAHLASVMLEYNLTGEVIGFSFDGLGLGDDGRLWGAEAMVADYKDYTRAFHFDYLPMPGGDKASKEPWRMAISYLYTYLGEGFRDLQLPLFDAIAPQEVENIIHMIDRSLNSPMISSAGRLFDAMASLLGITHRASYQAEAPMKLEALADMSEQAVYPFEILDGRVNFGPLIMQVVKDLKEGMALPKISGRFHQTLARVVLEMALSMRKEYEINRVVISGGVFQNRILTSKLWDLLSAEQFQVFIPKCIPVNDQGIAVGQLAIGAARTSRI